MVPFLFLFLYLNPKPKVVKVKVRHMTGRGKKRSEKTADYRFGTGEGSKANNRKDSFLPMSFSVEKAYLGLPTPGNK